MTAIFASFSRACNCLAHWCRHKRPKTPIWIWQATHNPPVPVYKLLKTFLYEVYAQVLGSGRF